MGNVGGGSKDQNGYEVEGQDQDEDEGRNEDSSHWRWKKFDDESKMQD